MNEAEHRQYGGRKADGKSQQGGKRAKRKPQARIE